MSKLVKIDKCGDCSNARFFDGAGTMYCELTGDMDKDLNPETIDKDCPLATVEVVTDLLSLDGFVIKGNNRIFFDTPTKCKDIEKIIIVKRKKA